MNERNQSSRTNETQEQRQNRLEKNREQTEFSRTNETEEQRQIRLEQQKKRSQVNRKEKTEKNKIGKIGNRQNTIRSPWPEPIPRDLKETRLQQFLEQMSMSNNWLKLLVQFVIFVLQQKMSKKIPLSKIPNIDLLKVSEELKKLIINSSENSVLLIG